MKDALRERKTIIENCVMKWRSARRRRATAWRHENGGGAARRHSGGALIISRKISG